MKMKMDNNQIRQENTCLASYAGESRKALLPHVVARVPLFVATRAPYERAGAGKEYACTNAWGDQIIITTRRRLYCDTDLSVFLSVIALAQQHKINRYDIGSRTFYLSAFPVSDLYELTQTSSKHFSRIYDSLRALGDTNLYIKFGAKRLDCRKEWVSKPFWDLEVLTRKGRAGNILDFNLNSFIVPNPNRHLFADVLKLQTLTKPISKGIFWTLLCREHMRGSIAEWQEVLGVRDTGKPQRWFEQSLLPSLEELSRIGFSYDLDTERKSILVRRYTEKKINATKPVP